jgi:leader peptidase (prepilin peptidase)/N-methyltransferase
MQHVTYIVFLFALGACVGSFLNVVVWRLPRIELGEKDGLWREIMKSIEGLSTPPSHCPKCDHKLAWYDNVPVLGWIFLGGKCRYCKAPISPRYPIVEFITGALFAGFYVLFFILHWGPCGAGKVPGLAPEGFAFRWHHGPTTIAQHWPIYALDMFLIAMLLAISLIDAELFIIPSLMPWLMAIVGIAVHTIIDTPKLPGALNLDPRGLGGALAAGAGLGLIISILLFHRGLIKQSFAEGEPGLEIDEELFEAEVTRARKEGREPPERPKIRTYTSREIRGEIRNEITFLLPPMMGGLIAISAVHFLLPVGSWWTGIMGYSWVSGFLGAVLGALVGAFMVWLARIVGTLIMGRVAMGLGDVHLMFGVGAIIGAGPAVVAFFLAPFAGMAVGIYQVLSRKKHELPYGPYLSLATAAAIIVYCPIADAFRPGLEEMGRLTAAWIGGH